MMTTPGRIGHLVLQVQTDYLDHPRLALTLPVAQTRFGLDEVTCAGVLGALVDAQVLTQRDGAYSRRVPQRACRGAV